MNEYEVMIEQINPCGGSAHGLREFLEVEAESPEAYVRANARYPITEITEKDGETVITAADGHGYMTRYYFT